MSGHVAFRGETAGKNREEKGRKGRREGGSEGGNEGKRRKEVDTNAPSQ